MCNSLSVTAIIVKRVNVTFAASDLVSHFFHAFSDLHFLKKQHVKFKKILYVIGYKINV